MVWKAVTDRFDQFLENIALTEAQVNDGNSKHSGVRSCLNWHYYNVASESANSFLVGSWGKQTRVRPPRDIDLLFILPNSVYWRFNDYFGNKQSAILQEVKGVLAATYPRTDMRGDGQVVVVDFVTYKVEVVPGFTLDSGRYLICDTNDGGRYKEIDPNAEISEVASLDDATKGNYRHLIRMLKIWQSNCNVPLKSFELELLAARFIRQWQYAGNSKFYYDWMARDFFGFLATQSDAVLLVPGTLELVYVADDWKTRAETAYARAVKAEQYEYADMVVHAGEEWQKIFGEQIPMLVV
jgi:hypothetical protein